MTEQPSQPFGDAGVPPEAAGGELEPYEHGAVQDAFVEFQAFLHAAAEQSVLAALDRVQPPKRLLEINDLSGLRRWWVTLRPVASLRQAAAFREALAQLPFCISAHAHTLSSMEITFRVTTVHLQPSEVQARVEQALQQAGYPGQVTVVPQLNADP